MAVQVQSKTPKCQSNDEGAEGLGISPSGKKTNIVTGQGSMGFAVVQEASRQGKVGSPIIIGGLKAVLRLGV